MSRYTLEIELISSASPGSGEGWAGVFDSDVMYDDCGLPFLSARRLKGLLRNAALDLAYAYQHLQMDEKPQATKATVDALFGVPGQEESASMTIGNAVLAGNDLLNQWLQWAQLAAPRLVTPEGTIQLFSDVRKQTRIDANGVAQEHSLRQSRVLKRGLVFSSEISAPQITPEQAALLKQAVQVTRMLGGKRNRGLGNIRCTLSEAPAEQRDFISIPPNPDVRNDNEVGLRKLDYRIGLLAPVLISSSVGDENLSMSEDYLRGGALLGMFASMFIRDKGLQNQAHKNKDFVRFFLSGKLSFLNAYPLSQSGNRSLPLPRSIQAPKRKPEQLTDKLFRRDKPQVFQKLKHPIGHADLSPIGGKDTTLRMEKVAVTKGYHFHHTRKDGVIGRSEDGEIFNYEAMHAGQEFGGVLVGDTEILRDFVDWLQTCTRMPQLGRSRNTEYGRVRLRFENLTPMTVRECEGSESEAAIGGGRFSLTLLANTILLNEHGESEVSEKALLSSLQELLGNDVKLVVEKAFISAETVENYVAIWKARRASMRAFAGGSSFIVGVEWHEPPQDNAAAEAELDMRLRTLQEQGIGIRRHEGFGRVATSWQKEVGILPAGKLDVEKRRKALEKALDGSTPPDTFLAIHRLSLQRFYQEETRRAAAQELEKFRAPYPPGSQISRLHQLARTAKDEADFKKSIVKLRPTARNQIARCEHSVYPISLLDFIQLEQCLEIKPASGRHEYESNNLWRRLVEARPVNDNFFAFTNANLAEGKKLRRAPAEPGETTSSIDDSLMNVAFKTFMTTFLALMAKKARLTNAGRIQNEKAD